MEARPYLATVSQAMKNGPQRPWQRAIVALEKTIEAHATRTALTVGGVVGCSSLAVSKAPTPIAILVTAVGAAALALPILKEAYDRFDVASQFEDPQNYTGRATSVKDFINRAERFVKSTFHPN